MHIGFQSIHYTDMLCTRVRCTEIQLDLTSSTATMMRQLAPLAAFDAVVNCAAISSPKECGENPALAHQINAPSALLDALRGLGHEPFFVQLSTDQVFSGTTGGYSECSEPAPVNEYGKSKLHFEGLLQDTWSRYAILRCSLMIGPPTPHDCPKASFVQFIDDALQKDTTTDFFTDEYRCPVHVDDVVAAIFRCIANQATNPHTKVSVIPNPNRNRNPHQDI